ncbi:MAG TPA: hypothetical protein VET88_10220 [Gammaproteobacteria bacterium]|nr:hypothetical protein [Gammaproteobacteria bacterium]
MERTITPNELQTLLAAGESITLLDVRRNDDRDKEPAAIPDARWLDPTDIEDWSNDLDADSESLSTVCAADRSAIRSSTPFRPRD